MEALSIYSFQRDTECDQIQHKQRVYRYYILHTEACERRIKIFGDRYNQHGLRNWGRQDSVFIHSFRRAKKEIINHKS